MLGLFHEGIPTELVLAADFVTREAMLVSVNEYKSGKSWNFETREWIADKDDAD